MKNIFSWRYFFIVCFLFVLNQANAIVGYTNTTPDSLRCGHISFKNGSYVKGVLIQITADSIKYRPCDSKIKKSSEVTRAKKDISRIVAADGAILYRSIEAENGVNESDTNRRFHPLAVVGAVLTIIGGLVMVVGSLFTSLIAILSSELLLLLFGVAFLFSIIGLILIRRNIKKYKGEKLTLAGIVIGIIILGLMLLDIL